MNINLNVDKPRNKGFFRKKIGKEYFIAKRKLKWFANRSMYAKPESTNCCLNTVVVHKSFLLRPLRDVDMHLQHNKITNLHLAIGDLNGVLIKPGKVMSVWNLVGRPTKNKGYLDGLVLHNGKISKGIGGGLCQLGNLLYWMALHTDLEITERWRHGFDVFPDINRKIPFACGATLSYNYVDLQLTNNTDMTFQIHLWLDDEYLNGKITCNRNVEYIYKVVETDHLIKQQWWGGYTRHNKIWKYKFDKNNDIINEQLVTENHAIMMYNPLLTE